MLKSTILLALVAFAVAEKETFENYKVFRLLPVTKEQTDFLHKISEKSNEYTFWNGPSHTNASADLMVGPEKISEFEKLMRATGTRYVTLVENVQQLIDNENPPKVKSDSDVFDLTRYHTVDEIYAHLDTLSATYPDNIQTIVAGKTYEGRQIKGIKLSFKKNNPGVFIEGGIHAREWISPAVVTYVINEFLTSEDPEVRKLAESNDWYIFPVFNPDGYHYTHTKNRLWRKTRRPYAFGVCHGADPNRNFAFKWNQGGASSNPCSETYAGPKALSEIEINTMSEYITSISGKIYAYLSFHSYSQLLLFPYGHTAEHLDNHDELYGIGSKTIEALEKRYGTKYVTGNIAETIYIATGSSVDWVKATFKLPIAYTYELRDTGKYGFVLPAEQIIPTGEETLDSLVALFKEAGVRGIPKRQ